MSETIHQQDCKNLRKRCQRISERAHLVHSPTVTIELDLAENLLDDHDDLEKLLDAHPALRREVSYG